MHLDLLIVGTGSGNSILTPDFADWQVGIVERGRFGGTCLNRGCIPSKMLVLPANRVVDAAEASRIGVHFDPPRIDWPSIRRRTFGRIDPIADDGEAYRRSQPNVTVLAGDARFSGERALVVTGPDGRSVEVTADRVVLAAGASPRIPAFPGLHDTPFHTSDTIMRIERIPEHLIVVGGGFIASELGHVFAAYGAKVTVVHRGPRLLSHEDGEVSQRFTDEFARRVELHLRTEVTDVEHHDDRFRLLLSPGVGHDRTACPTDVEGDALLITTGRSPNGAELGVEAAGVHLDADGYVITDDTLLTDAAGVWALGDIRNPRQLKHLANREAAIVSHNLLHPDAPIRLDERVVPRAVFSHPEVASVGEREEDLQARDHPYRVGRRGYDDVAYGWAIEDRSGFAKVLVCAETGLILGGHVIGPQAATLIHQISQAMTFGITAERLAHETIWAHPALPEVLENALLDAVAD